MWFYPEDPTPREQCPCCDYVTLPERGASLICLICYWEDDGQDVGKLDDVSGPNHIPLRKARVNFMTLGVCDSIFKGNVLAAKERSQFEYHPRNID
jgi:hypothetical protein